jgi:hypothetical protein
MALNERRNRMRYSSSPGVASRPGARGHYGSLGLSGLSVSMPRDVSSAHGHDLLRAPARLSFFAPLARPQELRFDK